MTPHFIARNILFQKKDISHPYLGKNYDDVSTFSDDVIKILKMTSDDVTRSHFHQNFRNRFISSYLTSVQIWPQSDKFQPFYCHLRNLGFNTGNIGYLGNFRPILDKSAIKHFLHMQSTQFFQEMCKTKLY